MSKRKDGGWQQAGGIMAVSYTHLAPYHLQKRMLADGSYEELPQREYVEEEGLPRQDKYAIGLPCPDTCLLYTSWLRA